MSLLHEIRPATLDDVEGISHVHVERWRTAYDDLLSAEFLADLSKGVHKRQWRQFLNESCSKTFTLVAESEGQVVGFVSGGPERTNDPLFSGEIYSLYLLENYRRHGIGTALFQRSIEFLLATKIASMKVWVLKDNRHRPFYERQGGHLVEEKVISIGGTELIEMAYGWETLEASPNRTIL